MTSLTAAIARPCALPGVLKLVLGADLGAAERPWVEVRGSVTSIRVCGHELLQAGPTLSRAFARVRP